MFLEWQMRAKVIAFINLKGGVAKTTTTVGLATALVKKRKKVLVIDLDPQTNATLMLMDQDRWQSINKKSTLDTLFYDAIYGTKRFKLSHAIQKNVSGIAEISTGLDLIASSTELIYLQDQIVLAEQGKFYNCAPSGILEQKLTCLKENYEYILIDCPPNLGVITLNGLMMADGYIIPTIPDSLSSLGIPQIKNHVKEFSKLMNRDIPCFGMVATKYRAQCVTHKRILDELSPKYQLRRFSTVFPENSDYVKATEYTKVKTIAKKWGKYYKEFFHFADEVMKL